MIRWQLASSLAAVLLSLALCLRQKQPLFFKILFYGLISYCFGTLFSFCYTFVYKAPPAGFHIGYLGQTGMYFFLLSSYYGAIDRLADGGERQYRGYRLLALAAPLVFLLFLLSLLHQGELNSSFAPSGSFAFAFSFIFFS